MRTSVLVWPSPSRRRRPLIRRRQRPLRGGRENIWSALDPRIKAWVQHECTLFGGCSESMLVNNALAFVAGIELYDPLPGNKK
jgi:hypothetical protein